MPDCLEHPQRVLPEGLLAGTAYDLFLQVIPAPEGVHKKTPPYIVGHGVHGKVAAKKVPFYCSFEDREVESNLSPDNPMGLDRLLSEKETRRPEYSVKYLQVLGPFEGKIIILGGPAQCKLPYGAPYE